jgi:hypothetical protein
LIRSLPLPVLTLSITRPTFAAKHMTSSKCTQCGLVNPLNTPANNERSLSGVIAHETTHLLIRKKFGYWRNLTMPTWKKEGYAEHVAGGTTLTFEAGVKMWKENPQDGTGYQYFKYYMCVKYLLEHDQLSVDDLFNREIDVKSLEERVLKSL